MEITQTRAWEKLVLGTKHDNFLGVPNPHKILGFTCLIHFAYRWLVLLFMGSMQFSTGPQALWVPALHMALSVSSLLFQVSKKRNMKHQVIWKELQLHNIVFTARSCAIFTYLTMYSSNTMLRAAIVMVFHLLADLVTKYYGQDRTMRDMSYDERVFSSRYKYYFDLYYAVSQFGAIVSLIFANSGREYAFNVMQAIQLSTFLMTLHLKGLISSDTWHVVYALSLFSTWMLPRRPGISETHQLYLIAFYAWWRLYGRWNKYVGMVVLLLGYHTFF